MTPAETTRLERQEADDRMAGLVVAIGCGLCSLASAALTYIVLVP